MGLRHFIRHIASLWLLFALPVAAQDVDIHDVFEQSCAQCHTPHAGFFVFQSLDAGAVGLAGRRSGLPLRDYLLSGHGRLSASNANALSDHLEEIFSSGRLYQDKCIICHDRAVVFSRTHLILKDDVLRGRYSGRDVRVFLSNHGRLRPEEIPVMIDRLSDHLRDRQAQ